MCIYEKSDVVVAEGTGYVLLIPNENTKRLCAIYGRDTYLPSRWYKARDYKYDPTSERSSINYEPGFHIFLSKRDAEYYQREFYGDWFGSAKVFQAKFKKGFLMGYAGPCNNLKCIVARERMVMSCSE